MKVDFDDFISDIGMPHSFATREQARQVAFEYIEVFYNRSRRHAKIGNQVPADFANQFYASRQQSAA